MAGALTVCRGGTGVDEVYVPDIVAGVEAGVAPAAPIIPTSTNEPVISNWIIRSFYGVSITPQGEYVACPSTRL